MILNKQVRKSIPVDIVKWRIIGNQTTIAPRTSLRRQLKISPGARQRFYTCIEKRLRRTANIGKNKCLLANADDQIKEAVMMQISGAGRGFRFVGKFSPNWKRNLMQHRILARADILV